MKRRVKKPGYTLIVDEAYELSEEELRQVQTDDVITVLMPSESAMNEHNQMLDEMYEAMMIPPAFLAGTYKSPRKK